MDADRHPQAHRARRGAHAPDPADHPLHLARGAACHLRVPIAVEQQQHGVAAPLHESGAVLVGGREELLEDHVQDVAHLLGADLAAAGELLRQVRETGDVREHGRAVDRAVRHVGHVAQPVDHEAGHIRRQHGRAVSNPTRHPAPLPWLQPYFASRGEPSTESSAFSAGVRSYPSRASPREARVRHVTVMVLATLTWSPWGSKTMSVTVLVPAVPNA